MPCSLRVWINRWTGENAAMILWIILSIAVLLQQFEITEPLVLGWFWITNITFFLGSWVNISYGIGSRRGFALNVGIQVLGIAVQLYLVFVHWDLLLKIDHLTRRIRSEAVGGCDHRLIGWVFWSLVTLLVVRGWLKRGFLFWPVRWQTY
jgi:hypothetical protein